MRWEKLISATWPCSQNYLSNYVFFVIIVFAGHENIGIEPKIIVLLCTVQKLWLFSFCLDRALKRGKNLISAIWPCSPNYLSNYVFFVIIMFADHVNIGKKPKIMILLCSVQKLWLFFITPNTAIRPYSSIMKIAITFEPYIVEPIFLFFYLCFNGLRI